jgi:tRNA(Ile)-lysidine synthase TilS/MesJ
MLESFQAFLRENSLCTPGNKILLTISGGVDSMVMLDLLVVLDSSVRLPIAILAYEVQSRMKMSDS